MKMTGKVNNRSTSASATALMAKDVSSATKKSVPGVTSQRRRGRGVRTDESATISERHLSPALRTIPPENLRIVPLTGVRALIYNRVWRPIADGRMKTGATLGESELEAVFGVSRTVIKSVLEHMTAEGSIVMPMNRSARVIEPTPEEAQAVFEALSIVMHHIVRELSSSSRVLTPHQRRLLDQHLDAQAVADEARDPIAAHLLGSEFLILLAALHGSTLLTDMVSRAVVLQTLSLKLYGRFPPPPRNIAFQRSLVEAILGGKQKEAVTEIGGRLAAIRASLVLDDPKTYEEDDFGKLLAEESAGATEVFAERLETPDPPEWER
jgi:DNA-binding GntR family transcriptional regulator